MAICPDKPLFRVVVYDWAWLRRPIPIGCVVAGLIAVALTIANSPWIASAKIGAHASPYSRSHSPRPPTPESQPTDHAQTRRDRRNSYTKGMSFQSEARTRYAELFPDYLAGGILFIREDTFESATLSTFDGDDYFIIGITTRALNIIVQDGDSTVP